jgi:hypothetical protein
MDRGSDKINGSLDIRNIYKSQKLILQLSKLILTPQQRILNGFGRQNYLNSGESSKGESRLDQESVVRNLEGLSITSKLDK